MPAYVLAFMWLYLAACGGLVLCGLFMLAGPLSVLRGRQRASLHGVERRRQPLAVEYVSRDGLTFFRRASL